MCAVWGDWVEGGLCIGCVLYGGDWVEGGLCIGCVLYGGIGLKVGFA